MDTSSLYDLTPIAWMMGAGVLLALGPLVWVWRRNAGSGPARRLHALTVLTLFLTFDLTLFGAFTRLTDSGLGCPTGPAATATPARPARATRSRWRRRPSRPAR